MPGPLKKTSVLIPGDIYHAHSPDNDDDDDDDCDDDGDDVVDDDDDDDDHFRDNHFIMISVMVITTIPTSITTVVVSFITQTCFRGDETTVIAICNARKVSLASD